MSLVAGIELKEFDSASLSGTYQNLGAVTADPAYKVVISNESNVGVYISRDGVTNEMRLSPGQILNVDSYPRHNDFTTASSVLKKGTQLKIKQVSGAGVGAIIVNVLTLRKNE